MLRTLADALAAAATRQMDCRKCAVPISRFGIERLEARNLLSASTGALTENYSWHFEDGPADRHAAAEPPAAVFRGGYGSESAGNDTAREFGQQFAAPHVDGFGDRYAPLRGGAAPASRMEGISSAPVSSSSYVMIIYVMQWDAPPSSPAPSPLKAMALPTRGNVGGGIPSGLDGGGTQGAQNADRPSHLAALTYVGTQPNNNAHEILLADSSASVVLQLDPVTSAVALTQGSNEGVTVNKSRLLQALQSHDAVFQALAAQTLSLRLRGANSWSDTGASSTGLSRVSVISQSGVDSHDEKEVSEMDALAAPYDAGGQQAARWRTSLESSNGGGVHASRRGGRRTAEEAQDADKVVAIGGAATPASELAAGDDVAAVPDEGGMVLLRTPGAENGVDAIDAAMERLEHGDAHGATIDMEAGVGMYRAFSVGAGESAGDPSVQAPGASTAAPTDAAREGVDAPRSTPSGAQLAAVAAGVVVVGAWGAKSRTKMRDERRPTSRVPG